MDIPEKNQNPQNINNDASSNRERTFRRSPQSQKIVGNPEDIIPFAWRNPLEASQNKKSSRIYKAIVYKEYERLNNSNVPAHREK